MKLALITGGSKGLGKALVTKYLSSDYEVLEFSRSGKSEHHIRCDFSDLNSFPDIFNSTLSVYKNSDLSEIILINNAGTIDPIGPISESEVQDWKNSIDINFTAAVLATGLFIKHFQSNACRKSIAFISSGAAITPKYGWALYCASKAGLEQFCNTVAIEQETEDSPINCFIINPHIMDTGMQFRIRSTNDSLFPEVQRFIEFKNDGLLRSPDSVADEIYSILSNPELESGGKYAVRDSRVSD